MLAALYKRKRGTLSIGWSDFLYRSGFVEDVLNVLASAPDTDAETLIDGADFVIAIASRDGIEDKECILIAKILISLLQMSVVGVW